MLFFRAIVRPENSLLRSGNPEYMTKLTFEPQAGAADADINTTGLTKADVMKGGQK